MDGTTGALPAEATIADGHVGPFRVDKPIGNCAGDHSAARRCVEITSASGQSGSSEFRQVFRVLYPAL